MPVGRLLVFLLIVGAVSLAAHRWFWARLVRDVTRRPGWRRAGGVALTILALSIPTGLGAWRALGPTAGTPVAWVGATWAGVLFLLVLWLGVGEALRGVARLLRRRRPRPEEPAVDPERRRFLARSLAGFAGAGAGSMAVVGLVEGAKPPEVVELTVPIRGLPAAFQGYRIVQLTDLHVGPLLRRVFIEDMVRRTNTLAPDLVAITGDLVDGPVQDLREAVAPLSRLEAPHGVWFVTGNHEYYMGVEAWLAHLRTLGVRPLRNERVDLRRGDEVIHLAGIDDASAARFGNGHGADLDKALAGRDPTRPVVLLAHQPRQVEDAQRLGVDLQLSGHTHGGQIAPFGWFVRLVQPAVAGLHRFGPTWLYVSRGAGYWGPPMRVANPAEITVVTLVVDRGGPTR